MDIHCADSRGKVSGGVAAGTPGRAKLELGDPRVLDGEVIPDTMRSSNTTASACPSPRTDR